MKAIITQRADSPVAITRPSATQMTAFTNGGFGRLPGDAVTSDIPLESKRIEVSMSMPPARAVENMLREGYAPDFAERWITSTLVGGESDASALDLIREQAKLELHLSSTMDETEIHGDRLLRNAWRAKPEGGGVYIDLDAAKTVFAERIIVEKNTLIGDLLAKVEMSQLTGKSDQHEAAYQALTQLNLRELGSKIMMATTVTDLLALWPDELLSVDPRKKV